MEIKQTMSLRIQKSFHLTREGGLGGGRGGAYGGEDFHVLFFLENLKVLSCFIRYCPLWVCCPYVVAAVMVIVCGSGFTDGFRKKLPCTLCIVQHFTRNLFCLQVLPLIL